MMRIVLDIVFDLGSLRSLDRRLSPACPRMLARSDFMPEQNGVAPRVKSIPRLLFPALNRGCESLRCSWWSPGFNMAGIKGVSGKAGSANILEAGERRYFGKGSSI